MRPIVVTPDKNGKISYTVEELEKLLEEVYNEGKKDGISQYPTIYLRHHRQIISGGRPPQFGLPLIPQQRQAL